MSNYLTLTAAACWSCWRHHWGRPPRWLTRCLLEVWPKQYKWAKQSTLRGRALDLCWHCGWEQSAEFYFLLGPCGGCWDDPWVTDRPASLDPWCPPSLLCLLPPKWEITSILNGFSICYAELSCYISHSLPLHRGLPWRSTHSALQTSTNPMNQTTFCRIATTNCCVSESLTQRCD